jgi:transcriptional regulator with XRE-family HTH domain
VGDLDRAAEGDSPRRVAGVEGMSDALQGNPPEFGGVSPLPGHHRELPRAEGPYFPVELRARREAKGWDQLTLAMKVRKAAVRKGWPEPNIDGNTISRWERGRQHPDRFYRLLLCEVLEADARELGLDQPPAGKLDPVKRRDFLRYLAVAGGSGVGPGAVTTALESLERLGRALESTCKVDEETVQFLDHRFARHWHDYYAATRPGLDLLPGARHDLNAVSDLLNRSLSPSMRQRLTAIAGRGAIVMGALLWDMGIYSESRQVLKMAVTAGRDAYEPQIEAIALAWTGLSWMSDSAMPPSRRAALDSAAAGRRLFTCDTVVGAWLAAIEAEAHANLGNASACLSALRDSEQAGDLGAHGDDWYWSRFDQSGLAGFRGVCMLSLNKPVDAQEALHEAIQVLHPSEGHRRLTLVTDLARAYAKADAVEPACSLGQEAMQMCRELKSPVKVQRLNPLRHDLADRRDASSVKHLEDELLTEVNRSAS